MKNRILYILIALMAISVLGIIAIQSFWVSSAISERKKEFSTRVNDALNSVNDGIDKEEAVFFLEERFGTIDSLLHEIILIDDDESSQVEITYDPKEIANHNGEHKIIYSPDDGDNPIADFQINMDHLDSVIDFHAAMSEFEEKKLDKITSVVKRFTFESMLSGDLEDRLSMESISELVKKSLVTQGIDSDPEIAIYNVKEKKIESGFKSDEYQHSEVSDLYSKRLFPNDHVEASQYDLNLQFKGNNEYVWSGIRWMVFLCIIFTLLILVCFSYSLYSIFKQKRISQVKNDFINNMTHELKTPLATISLAAASIEHPRVIGDESEVHRFIDIIKSEERRINAHVERVLDVAALDKSDLKMDLEEIDLHELLTRSIQNVDLSLSASNGTAKLTSSNPTAPFNGDAFHLTNVFTNILDNSIKYSQENLEITIALLENEKEYLITLKDNGIGMSKKSQKLAFDKFYRAETGNIHTRKGFGLGLSYVKSIVEAHFGNVELNSELNLGTTVTVTLPKK
ncbi:MAG: two-component system phosphate regulon sensor histidine kinase PhoR [Crocinitomicaceae bacterium]|jgi:two-component system phosphate regulon sensor histidine kinase PhoR